MMLQEKLLVLVLGMHRSGTSAVARALNVMGVELGDRLMPPTKDNAKGYFEDLDLVGLDSALLTAAGATWLGVGRVSLNDVPDAKLEELRAKAASWLHDRFNGRNSFGIKDPRLCLLLPFWMPIFEQLGLQVKYVLACRNPVSVADSLAKRDGFGLDYSLFLWARHVCEAVLSTHANIHAVIDYDDLLDDSDSQILTLSRNLGLESELKKELLDEYREQFLSEGLRHARHNAADLSHRGPVHELVMPLYAALRQAACAESSQPNLALLTAAQSASAALDGGALLPARLEATQVRLNAVVEAFEASKQTIEQAKHNAAGLHTKLAEADAQLDRFALALGERTEQLVAAKELVAQKDRRIEVLESLLYRQDSLLQQWGG